MSRTKSPAREGGEELGGDMRRLLTRLERGCAIKRDGDGGFHLTRGQAGAGAAPGKGLPRELVEACLASDWLQWRGEALVLSDTGRSWLRRSASDDDAFRQQHQLRTTGEREINGTSRPVLVNEAESPLGWLKNRKDRNGRPLIAAHQYEAGERLRADYWFAHLSPRVTANWSALAPSDRSRRGSPSNAAALRDEVIAAKERVMRALNAVGPEVAGVLVDICCELKGLEEAEKANGWPQRAGKVVLQIALTRLARHYGLIGGDETQRRARSGLRHWGSEDYRPTLEAWSKGPRRDP